MTIEKLELILTGVTYIGIGLGIFFLTMFLIGELATLANKNRFKNKLWSWLNKELR